jgi:hypothetical protein
VVETRHGVPGDEWDAALRRAGGHFYQSSGWQQVQETLGSPVSCSIEPDEWMWAAHLEERWTRYLYVPCGPTLMRAASAPACFSDLRRNAEGKHITFVRLEPTGACDVLTLRDSGALEVRPRQPRDIWLLDLTVDEAALRRGLERGHRARINAAERKGLRIRRSTDPDDVAVLIAMLAGTARRTPFRPFSQRYYRTVANLLMPRDLACLYIAEADGRPVAAAMGFDFNRVRYYAHAGSDPAARRLSPHTPLVWRMILDAKSQGAVTFDFLGVMHPVRPGHPWAGFTQFKQAFGGRLETRAGTWELPVRRRRYRVHAAGREVAVSLRTQAMRLLPRR